MLTAAAGQGPTKREAAMDKILFMTGESGPDPRLLKALASLFPECLIEVVSAGRQASDEQMTPPQSVQLTAPT
jgi:hypothetical protein